MEDAYIRYAVISNRAMGVQLLSEHQATGCTVDASRVALTVLKDIKMHNHKLSRAVDDDYLYHYIVSDNVVYSCLADRALERRVPFDFLEALKTAFSTKYRSQWQQVLESRDMKGYNSELKKLVERANKGDDDVIRTINKQTEELQGMMQKNIEAALGRGERVDDLVNETKGLDVQASKFKSRARDLHWRMWTRKVRMIVLVVFILLIIAWIISSIVCGFDYKKCTGSSSSSEPSPSPAPSAPHEAPNSPPALQALRNFATLAANMVTRNH